MGDDQIHMDTASTTEAMNRVAVAGRTMTDDWHGASAEITHLAGQLGRGDLGTAFLDAYLTPAAQIANNADQHCQRPQQLADTGNACIDSYRSADAACADTIRAVSP
jgi:hypothetical protein